MLVHILSSLSVENKLGFIGHPDDMVLHGMTEESGKERIQLINDKNTARKLNINVMLNSYIGVKRPFLNGIQVSHLSPDAR